MGIKFSAVNLMYCKFKIPSIKASLTTKLKGHEVRMCYYRVLTSGVGGVEASTPNTLVNKQTTSTSSSHYSGVMALSGVIRGAFLTAVLLYFTGDQSLVDGGADYSRYKDFLMENYEDWIMLVSLAFKYGVPGAHETITEYLDELRDKCQKNESCRTTLNLLQRLYQKYKQKMRAMKIIAVILKLGPKLAQDIFRKTQ